jgi:hypothetical protein
MFTHILNIRGISLIYNLLTQPPLWIKSLVNALATKYARQMNPVLNVIVKSNQGKAYSDSPPHQSLNVNVIIVLRKDLA